MVVFRFKSDKEHKEIKHKLKEMKEFIEDLCYMIEERAEEDYDDEDYRDEYEDMPRERGSRMNNRYSYRNGGGRGGRR